MGPTANVIIVIVGVLFTLLEIAALLLWTSRELHENDPAKPPASALTPVPPEFR